MQIERFEWDENKNQINYKKHGVWFQEAQTVFSDSSTLYLDDDEHSQDEKRSIAIGESTTSRLLLVCHCERESGIVTRIFSARKAVKREIEMFYEELL